MKVEIRVLRSLVLCGLLSLAGPWLSRAEAAAPITNENVVSLVEAGVSEANILSIISMTETAFSLTPQDIVELKKAKVSEAIIKAMIHAHKNASPRSPSKRTEPQTQAINKNAAPQKVERGETETDLEDEELRLIASFEAERSESMKSPEATDPMVQEESADEKERRLIEEFEAERSGSTVEPEADPKVEAEEVENPQIAAHTVQSGATGGSKLPLVLAGVGGGAAAAVLAVNQSGDPIGTDDDGDGYSENQGDCSDGNPQVHPNGSVSLEQVQFVKSYYDCPKGGSIKYFSEQVSVNFTNNSCTPVTIESASFSIKATQSVGPSGYPTRYTAWPTTKPTFSPSVASAGSMTTIRLDARMACLNANPPGNFGAYGYFKAYEGRVTLFTSVGELNAETSNRLKVNFPLQGFPQQESEQFFAEVNQESENGPQGDRPTDRSKSKPDRRHSIDLSLSWVTELAVAGAKGEVRLNEKIIDFVTEGLHHLAAEGRARENRIDAQIVFGDGSPGTLRFDFSATENVRAGSIRVLEGQAVQISSHGIIFQLRGLPGERVSFLIDTAR